MSKTNLRFARLISALVLSSGLLAAGAVAAESVMEKGKAVAFDRKKGNCLGCHAIDDGSQPGNIGPPLIAMKVRYPDKAKLREQIYDSTKANPNSIMPPFGKHGALSDAEIDAITEYIYSL